MLHFNMWLQTLSSTAAATSVLVLFLQRATCHNRHYICFCLNKVNLWKTKPPKLKHDRHYSNHKMQSRIFRRKFAFFPFRSSQHENVSSLYFCLFGSEYSMQICLISRFRKISFQVMSFHTADEETISSWGSLKAKPMSCDSVMNSFQCIEFGFFECMSLWVALKNFVTLCKLLYYSDLPFSSLHKG